MLESILFPACLFTLGLIILIKGSDIFVDGAANTALKMGVSEHLIGLTLVAFATSLPELGASTVASFTGYGDISLGNVIGSNICNICLVLGIAALLIKLEPGEETFRDAVFMNIVAILLFVLVLDREIDRIDGIIFIVAFVSYVFYLYKTLHVGIGTKKGKIGKELTLVALGAIGVIIGSYLLVTGAIDIAEEFNIAPIVIALFAIAFGTSLPELATSVSAALKRRHSISIGNVLGSNIINILFVLGVAALIRPINLNDFDKPVADSIINTTLPLLMFVSIIMLLFSKHKIGRTHAIFLLFMYGIFIYFLPGVMT
ncbi:MAG: calcium/sodium antiporter [Thermoplasmata archaeon]|nr:calcium/sodium antiporter [Thermoplasmata archaeon]